MSSDEEELYLQRIIYKMSIIKLFVFIQKIQWCTIFGIFI